MQNLVNDKNSYQVVIEATCHAWRKPFATLFEWLFRAGDAVRLGKTTLFVKDRSGRIIHQEYYGKSRKKAWYRKLEIEENLKALPHNEFIEWLRKKN